MSKLTEALGVLFGKKINIIGQTSFELKDDGILHVYDGSYKTCFEPSALGVISIVGVDFEGSDSKSKLLIDFPNSNIANLEFTDTYALNEKKMKYLLNLKKESKKVNFTKIVSFLLLAVFNILLVIFIALMILNPVTGSKISSSVEDGSSNQSNFHRKYSEPQIPTQNSAVSAVNLSPEQKLLARNNELTRPNPELASLLQKGVNAGDYSFTLGNPAKTASKGTLYVFSDPLCPRCQELEPLLEELSSDYQIQIFPVSVVGTPDAIKASSRLVTTVLCEAPASRSSAWHKIMSDPNTPTTECEVGPIALKNNVDTFRTFKFIGTPALVRADGASFDLTKVKNAESVTRWLGEGVQ